MTAITRINNAIRNAEVTVLEDGTVEFYKVFRMNYSQQVALGKALVSEGATVRVLPTGLAYGIATDTTSLAVRISRTGEVKVNFTDYTIPAAV